MSPATRSHAVLLGDSIFDNHVYVAPAPAVINQLREALGSNWEASLLAVDGDATDDVAEQLTALPDTATHLVVSVGGNDALPYLPIMAEAASTIGDALLKLAQIRDAFTLSYERMLDCVMAHQLPVTVCTVYDPNFDIGPQQEMAVVALAAFNDSVTRAAFRRGLPVIDLRVLFSEPAHYANPIEPSALGGARLAAVIARVLTEHDFGGARSTVYGAVSEGAVVRGAASEGSGDTPRAAVAICWPRDRSSQQAGWWSHPRVRWPAERESDR